MPPKKPAAKTAAKPAAKSTAPKTVAKGKAATSKAGSTSKAPAKTETKAAAPPQEPLMEEVVIETKAINNVVILDNSGEIKKSGKWPLVRDESDVTATFLRYRDANNLLAYNKTDMETERLRLAILGAVWYGKPLVIDLMEMEDMKIVVDHINAVQAGLFDAIMDKSIMEYEKVETLMLKHEEKDFSDESKLYERNKNFMFVVIAKKDIDVKYKRQFYLIKVENNN